MIVRLEVTVLLASIAGAVLWVEHGHRIDIETPAGAAFAAPVCPESENVPYSVDCITFMQGDGASEIRWRASAVKVMPAAPSAVPDNLESIGPACPPNNENVPYSANCLRFLSGWFWRANGPDGLAATPGHAPK